MWLFSQSLMAGVGRGTGENESQFEFKTVDASLIPPRPGKY
ncbi:MAG: hypothetical protein ACLPHI_22425 [Terriglobales bacterium]|jgi:hypothetical protein